MTVIRGIVFDKDGTLFDFSSTWEAWAASFLHRLAKNPAQAMRLGSEIGFDLTTRRFSPDSIVIAGTPGEVVKALLPHVPGIEYRELLDLLNDEAESAPQVEAVPLQAYLTDLRGSGLRLGVVTNDAEAPARTHLGKAGVTGQFDFIAGFDSGFGAKPAPGQLLAFAEAMDISPAEIVMVGDSLHDLVAAHAAGMRPVGVLTGLASAETLDTLAEVVLPDIGHLPAWLKMQITAAV